MFFPGPLSLTDAVEEIKRGCASLISVICHKCGKPNEISTCRQHESGKRGPGAYDINTRIALGAIDSGIGYTHVNSAVSSRNDSVIRVSDFYQEENCKNTFTFLRLLSFSYQCWIQQPLTVAKLKKRVRKFLHPGRENCLFFFRARQQLPSVKHRPK